MTSKNLILVREFKYNSIKIKDKIKISRFMPIDLKNLIDLNVPVNDYILGVSYSSGESQICISGHPKENENMIQGTCRELCEELSLSLKNKNDLTSSYNDKINHFYFLNINSTELVEQSEPIYGKDIKARSIICVHGNLKDILYYLTNLKYKLNNEDSIDSVWATSKENIVKYLAERKYFLYNY